MKNIIIASIASVVFALSAVSEVYAIDKDGNRIEAYFDPKSLKMLRKKSDD